MSPAPRRSSRAARGVYRRTTANGPVWLALVRVKGYKAVSKTFDSRAAAEAWSDATKKELRKQRAGGETRADLPTLTISGLINEYLADPAIKALRSYENTHDLLDWWVLHSGTKRVLDLGVLGLRDAREKLQPGRAPATVNRHLSAMRTAWNWGRTAGLVPTERAWPTKLMLPEPKGRTRYLNDAELASLLDAAANQSATMHAMVVISLATGVRQGELLRLTWADVDFERSRIRLLITKNNTSRAVHLPAVAAAALKGLRRVGVVSTKNVFLTDQGEPYIKNKLTYPWHLVREAAGLADFRWHDLRHSCASFLAQKGASLLEIGSVLGHKSPSVTMRYAHLVEGKPVTGHAALDDKLSRRS